jgi:hypothetical protein
MLGVHWQVCIVRAHRWYGVSISSMREKQAVSPNCRTE